METTFSLLLSQCMADRFWETEPSSRMLWYWARVSLVALRLAPEATPVLGS